MNTAKRVLVVDDNPDAAETLVDLLGFWGYQVRAAFSGAEALAAARQEPPEVVILDLAMPQMDGWECARRLRGMEQFRETLLIALSGFNGAEHRERSQSAGFDYHLSKPADPQLLRRLLNGPPAGA